MFAVALALIVVGIVLGFLVPPFGFLAAAVGLVLLVLYLVAASRRAASTR